MTRLTRQSMVDILKKNFNFKEVIDEDYGSAIRMNSRNAFRYSLIEGSPYLTSENGFTCKGRMNVFYHRSSLNKNYYTYCPGLFGVKRIGATLFLDEGSSPYYIKKQYPSIFRGDKTILFYENTRVLSRVEIERQIFEKIKSRGDNPASFLLTIVSDSESYKENFLEYIACQYFNNLGYLTECQVPFQNNKGIPDFAAYSTSVIGKLFDNKIIPNGCCIPEIAASGIFKNNDESSSGHNEFEIMIGEAKSGPTHAKEQIRKHKKTKLADYIFEMIPYKQKPQKDFGLFTIDCNNIIKFEKGPKQHVNKTLHESDEKFLENYVKFYIIANLPIEKIINKYIDRNIAESDSSQLIRKILSQDLLEIIDYVKDEIDK